MRRGVDKLLRWCVEHGVEMDGRLDVRVAADGSMGVFAKPDACIDIGESCEPIPPFATLWADAEAAIASGAHPEGGGVLDEELFSVT